MLSPNGIVTAEKCWLMFVSAFFQQLNCLIWKFARASYGRRTFQIGRRHCFFFLRLKKRVASFREKNVNICDTVVGTNLAHLCSKCLFFPHPRFGFPGHPQRTMVSQAWEENPMGFYTLENTHTLDKSHTFPTVIDDLCRYDHPVLLYIQTLFC